MEGTEAESEYDFCNDIDECKFFVPYKEMEDTYRIIKITDKEGNNRTDGRYPLRIGRLCKEPEIERDGIGPYAYLYYLENADGSDYSGKVMCTSYITKIEKTKEEMKIETNNSIYYLKKEEKGTK